MGEGHTLPMWVIFRSYELDGVWLTYGFEALDKMIDLLVVYHDLSIAC